MTFQLPCCLAVVAGTVVGIVVVAAAAVGLVTAAAVWLEAVDKQLKYVYKQVIYSNIYKSKRLKRLNVF